MHTYTRRVLIAVGIVLAVVVAAAFVWHALHVLLLVFAAALLALVLRAAGDIVRKLTRLPEPAAIGVALGLITAALVVLVAFTGRELARQIDHLTVTLPPAVASVRTKLQGSAIGRTVLAGLPPDPGRWMRGLFPSALGGVVDAVVVVFLAIYFAFDARRHHEFAARVFPPAHRPRVREVLTESSTSLRAWMRAQLVAVAFVGVLVTVTLWILGVPLAPVLGLLAGICNFVPYVGPLIAIVPALLFALSRDPITAAWLVGAWLVIQNVEAYVLTPLIQRRAVHIAPSLILISELILGLWAGVIGIIVATPLAVVVTVLVRKLWIEEVLGEDAP